MSDAPLRVIVFGATGTAGSATLREALADARIGAVTVVTRRPTGVTHAKLTEVVCADFAELAPVADHFAKVDICFFCLGIAVGQTSGEAEYRKITVTYPLAAAKLLLERSPGATFVFLSGSGADPRGKSWMMWARVKGEAENALSALGLKKLVIARPGYIHPDPDHKKKGAGAVALKVLFPIMSPISIRARQLGLGLIQAALTEVAQPVQANGDLRKLAKSHPAQAAATSSA